MDNQISLILKIELAFLSRRHFRSTRGVSILFHKVYLKHIIFKSNRKLDPAFFFCTHHVNSLLLSIYVATLK